MKMLLSGFAVALCVCAAEGRVWAQAAEPQYHAVITYIKVTPGMGDAYRTFLENESTKFYQEMLKERPTLVHWSTANVMYPGLENTEYDVVSASVFAGPPPEPATVSDAVYQRASGLSRVDYQKKLAGMRTVVGTELLRSVARAAAPVKVGDFRVSTQLRIKPNMASEFADLVQNKSRPMMELRRNGGELKSWSMWSRRFPSGAGTTYDALTVSYYPDLASAVKGLDPAKGAEAFAKAHPGKNYATYMSDQGDYAEVQNRAIHRLVALVERPAAAPGR